MTLPATEHDALSINAVSMKPFPTPGPLARMSPAYFGMVMATGIVSLTAHFLGMHGVGVFLYYLNIVIYVILCVLTVLRAVRYPRQFFGDMIDHLRGPGFFTTIAGTSILGTQSLVLAEHNRAAMVLWVVAVTLWVVLTYTIFTALTVKTKSLRSIKALTGAGCWPLWRPSRLRS